MRGLLFLVLALPAWAWALLPVGFEQWPAAKQRQFIWEQRIQKTVYGKPPSLNGVSCAAILNQTLAPLSFLSLNKTFDHFSDELPTARRKFIHPFGSVALVRWEIDAPNPYTGLFTPGEAIGLVRLSLAAPPHFFGYIPGMALKLFIDGEPSQNLLVMHSLEGQGKNSNFFAHPFTNILPKVKPSLSRPRTLLLKFFEAIFATAKSRPGELSLVPMAGVYPSGLPQFNAKAPWKIYFVPNPDLQRLFEENGKQDFRKVLAEIPPGTTLSEIWAQARPEEAPVRLGSLKMESSFVASSYGDERLFFRHPR